LKSVIKAGGDKEYQDDIKGNPVPNYGNDVGGLLI